MTAGLRGAQRAGADMPGPTLYAEVGDVLVVHFRNARHKLGQALTMHPHGVRYTPDYDGAYLGEYTRVGGFVAPGEEFTYTWECDAGRRSASGPTTTTGPTTRSTRSAALFGAIVIRERGAKVPDVEHVLFLHQLRRRSPASTAPSSASTAARPPATRRRSRRKVGQDVAIHVIGMDSNFHDFHIHGHRWKDTARRVRRHPDRGAERDDHRPLHRGQPGPLALPLPRLLPPGRGDGGLVHVEA